jgi:hypothetical protein
MTLTFVRIDMHLHRCIRHDVPLPLTCLTAAFEHFPSRLYSIRTLNRDFVTRRCMQSGVEEFCGRAGAAARKAADPEG